MTSCFYVSFSSQTIQVRRSNVLCSIIFIYWNIAWLKACSKCDRGGNLSARLLPQFLLNYIHTHIRIGSYRIVLPEEYHFIDKLCTCPFNRQRKKEWNYLHIRSFKVLSDLYFECLIRFRRCVTQFFACTDILEFIVLALIDFLSFYSYS